MDARRQTLFGSALALSAVVFLSEVIKRWLAYIPLGAYGLVSAYYATKGQQVEIRASDVSLWAAVGVLMAGTRVFHELRLENLRLRGLSIRQTPAEGVAAICAEGDSLRRNIQTHPDWSSAHWTSGYADWSGKAIAVVRNQAPEHLEWLQSEDGFPPRPVDADPSGQPSRDTYLWLLDGRLGRLRDIETRLRRSEGRPRP